MTMNMRSSNSAARSTDNANLPMSIVRNNNMMHLIVATVLAPCQLAQFATSSTRRLYSLVNFEAIIWKNEERRTRSILWVAGLYLSTEWGPQQTATPTWKTQSVIVYRCFFSYSRRTTVLRDVTSCRSAETHLFIVRWISSNTAFISQLIDRWRHTTANQWKPRRTRQKTDTEEIFTARRARQINLFSILQWLSLLRWKLNRCIGFTTTSIHQNVGVLRGNTIPGGMGR